MSEITPGTQDLLDSPTPDWLDRDYPYVAPPGEDHTLQELDYLVSLIPLRKKWASFIRAADEDMTPLFIALCSELGAPCDEEALDEMASEASILITKLKWLYNRPRPYQVAERHLRLSGQGGVFKERDLSVLDSKSAHSPAYPSGHTIQAHLMASRLSETSPQHRKAFMDLAEKVSFSRAVAGYHWPSDLVFGKDIFRHIVMPSMPSAIRVAKTFTVNKGDAVWYGKYKNQRGLVKNFGMSDKGDPTVTVEQLPSPSARKPKKKSPKTLNLFKIRPRKKDEHDEGGKKAGGSRTLYYVGKRPAQPKPKRAEWRQRGQDTPDWVRPWLDAPVSKGVFLTPNPFLVAPKHGVFGHVYAYEVPHWVIKQAKGIHRKDGASEVLIPEPLWKHVKLKGKSMDREDFLDRVYRSEDAAFTGSRARNYRSKFDWEAIRNSRLASVPKKYEHIDFVPPEGVASAAAKGLELRQKASPSNKGGLTPAEASKQGIGSGVQRAVNLKNRDPVSPKVIKQMKGFLSRSEKSSEISEENRGTPWNDKGYVAWLLWGGDPAKAWVEKVIKQMEAADRKQRLAASKARSKKEVPKSDGSGTTTVYEYGPRQVAQRHKEKAVRIEALRKKMADLRQKARGDLTVSDPETRLTALAICLMDETYARVGNEKSAEEGHHGVTNWKADHVTLADKSATVRYTGKSGVKQEKKITNARVLSALRKALKGKGKGDKVLCDGDECSILAKDVNAYLKPFDITAKDIRGLHANEEMKHHLKAQRKTGPADLPRSRKERDEILKAEFQAALDLAAAAVGHEASTLRSQYLVPSMEASYTHDGTVLDRLDKKATLSDSEREDREAERLVRQSPKLKPPRKDKERGRIRDADPDTDPDEKQDQKDRSNNYKDAAVAKAMREYLSLTAGAAKSKRRSRKQPSPREVARRKRQSDTAKTQTPKRKSAPKLKEAPAPSGERQERNVGDTWEVDGKWSAKGKDSTESGFASQDAAKDWLSGGPKPGASGDDAADSSPAADSGSGTPTSDSTPAKKAPAKKPSGDELVALAEKKAEHLSNEASEALHKLNSEMLAEVLALLPDPVASVVDAAMAAGSIEELENQTRFAESVLRRIPRDKPPTDAEITEARKLVRKYKDMDIGLNAGQKKELREVEKTIASLDAKSWENDRDFDEKPLTDEEKESLKKAQAKKKQLDALNTLPRAEQAALREAEDTLRYLPDENPPSAKEIAEALVTMRAAEVRKDPLLMDLSNPLTSKSTEPLNLEGAAQKEFMGKMGDLTLSTTEEYREMPKGDREAHREGLGKHLDKLEKDGHTDTEQYHSTLAQVRGLQMASALEDGDDAVGVSPEFQTFLKAAESQGPDILDKFIKLNVTGAAEGDVDAQQQFRDVLRGVGHQDLLEMMPKDHIARDVLGAMTGSHLKGKMKDVWMKDMDSETMSLLQEHMEDMIMDDIIFTDMDMVRDGATTGEQKKKGKTPAKKKQQADRVSRHKSRTKSLLELLGLADGEAMTSHGKPKSKKSATPSATKRANHTLTEAYDFQHWGSL